MNNFYLRKKRYFKSHRSLVLQKLSREFFTFDFHLFHNPKGYDVENT